MLELDKAVIQEQKKVHPTIDSIISDYLEGDILESASQFVDWMKANKMSPRWSSTNTWSSKYKRRDANGSVCYIKVGKGFWSVFFNRILVEGYENFSSVEALSESTWYGKMDYIKHCRGGGCHNNCAEGKKKYIGDHFYEDICWCMPIVFHNPDPIAMDSVKMLIQFRQKLIENITT